MGKKLELAGIVSTRGFEHPRIQLEFFGAFVGQVNIISGHVDFVDDNINVGMAFGLKM